MNWGSGGPFSHVRKTTSNGNGSSISKFALDFGKTAGNHTGFAVVQRANQARNTVGVRYVFAKRRVSIVALTKLSDDCCATISIDGTS